MVLLQRLGSCLFASWFFSLAWKPASYGDMRYVIISLSFIYSHLIRI